jgi:hypothetical protein
MVSQQAADKLLDNEQRINVVKRKKLINMIDQQAVHQYGRSTGNIST